MQLLLLADEQESMIDQYLYRGRMFVLFSLEPGVQLKDMIYLKKNM